MKKVVKELKRFILFRGWEGSTRLLAVGGVVAFGVLFLLPALPALLAGEPHGYGALLPYFVGLAVAPGLLVLFAHFLLTQRDGRTPKVKYLAALACLALYGATGYLGLNASAFKDYRRQNSIVYFCVHNTQVETCERWAKLDENADAVRRLPAGIREQIEAKLNSR